MHKALNQLAVKAAEEPWLHYNSMWLTGLIGCYVDFSGQQNEMPGLAAYVTHCCLCMLQLS